MCRDKIKMFKHKNKGKIRSKDVFNVFLKNKWTSSLHYVSGLYSRVPQVCAIIRYVCFKPTFQSE